MNMDRKPTLKTTNKLLKLRGILDQIGQASWSFSVLNKQYPIHTLSNLQAEELIESYEALIKKVISLLKSEYESKNTTHSVLDR